MNVIWLNIKVKIRLVGLKLEKKFHCSRAVKNMSDAQIVMRKIEIIHRNKRTIFSAKETQERCRIHQTNVNDYNLNNNGIQ